MLCCWLQQLQEFGGPEMGGGQEIEKPDLLKGSIGSLKNVINNSTSSTTAKQSSGPGSLTKYKNLLDMRPRYNVKNLKSL